METTGLIVEDLQCRQYVGAEVDNVWLRVCFAIADAAESSGKEFVAHEIYNWVRAGKMQLWVVRAVETDEVKFVVVTELLQFPQKRVCNIYAIAGRDTVEGWRTLRPVIKAWLTANDLSVVQATCTEAAARLWRCLGFRTKRVVIELSIQEDLL